MIQRRAQEAIDRLVRVASLTREERVQIEFLVMCALKRRTPLVTEEEQSMWDGDGLPD